MATYPKVTLRKICEAVEYGYTASAASEPIGPRFLRITDIVPDVLSWDRVPFCEIDEKTLAKLRLRTGDIAIARTGATTGWAKFIRHPPEAVFASYLVRIRVDSSADARFVGYVVESPAYKHFIQQHMGGAAQPNANAQVLTSFDLPLPPVHVQRRIAEILSAYDALIENNLRRIQILEQMARALTESGSSTSDFLNTKARKPSPRLSAIFRQIGQYGFLDRSRTTSTGFEDLCQR